MSEQNTQIPRKYVFALAFIRGLNAHGILRANIKLLLFAIATIIVTIIFSSYRSYLYLTYQHLSYKVGLNLNNIVSQDYVDWIKSQPNRAQDATTAVFLDKNLPVPIYRTEATEVLGTTTVDDAKWIEIDLSEQRLYMKENGNTVASFLVSTGKWAPTPTGEWRIWTKLRYTRMTGGSKALRTYYDLPNVPYVMYYYQGYGIHGAYWHNNFGQPMSHGCVNMRPEEAGIVFNWATVGTRVVVQQ